MLPITSPIPKRENSPIPRLYLAPMEGLGDSIFRKSILLIGGFDEATTEFIRVPKNACVDSLSKVYQPKELEEMLLTPQIMGDNPFLCSEMAKSLIEKGAPRIDLNCGCPSNTVVGRGAGSSLLRTPDRLFNLVSSIRSVCSVPFSVKMRSGFEDSALFLENLKAIEGGGADFLTLHPRTKLEGYSGLADWSLITKAKSVLKIPLVGNGDIDSKEKARKMWDETGCDALMIGRGAAINPWIFHEIRSHFTGVKSCASLEKIENYLRRFCQETIKKLPKTRNQVNKIKQLVQFLYQRNASLAKKKKDVLRTKTDNPNYLLEIMLNDLLAIEV